MGSSTSSFFRPAVGILGAVEEENRNRKMTKIEKEEISYGPLEWREIYADEMVPKGFHVKFDLGTGKNYACVPRRLCLPHKYPEWKEEICIMATWGDNESNLQKMQASLEEHSRYRLNGIRHAPVAALCQAVQHGHHQLIKLLLEYRAQVLAFDEHGQTPLHRACQSGNEKVIFDILQRQTGGDAKETPPSSPEEDPAVAMRSLLNHQNQSPMDILREQDLNMLLKRIFKYLQGG